MKSKPSDFCIFGGPREFDEPLHIGRPNIGDRQKLLTYINDILDKRWLTNKGGYVQEFEKRIADFVGADHCIAMCNGTIALEIAIRALGLKGEVIVPAFTFIATVHSLQWQEITPVFCDVNPDTHAIDPTRLEKLITPKTTGIIGVHTWGQGCEIYELEQLAKTHKLGLLFDAAHAFGSTYDGKMIGSFGEAEIFSFHATKFINSFEGGAVVTNDEELSRKIRLMKNFGFTGYDQVDYIGTNGKMNEVCAAMGLTSMDNIEAFVDVNIRNYQTYKKELSGIPGIRLFPYNESEKHNYQYVVLEVIESETGISRNNLLKILHAENVIARRYFYPGCHRMEPYRSYFPHAGLLLPETEKLVERVLILPTGTAVGEAEVKNVCHIIRKGIENSRHISSLLNEK